MHYVILRDDDTCACTPFACLERLYRPFLERGMPVNLAVIPEVRTNVRMPDGRLEGFLSAGLVPDASLAPIGRNRELVGYLRGNPGFQVAQHGCHHDLFEFGGNKREEMSRRLDQGARLLREAGFARPPAFVAPYDRLSRAAFPEVAKRFDVISTGWFEARGVPLQSLPGYALKKLGGRRHWRSGGKYLLSHPGCLLSYTRPRAGMMASVRKAVEDAPLTVLVVHWWEFFREGTPDDGLIGVLHEVCAWLSSRRDIRVVSFGDVAAGRVPIS
jgi:Uncharacterized protein conserved in bacteria (DUF2334)